MSCGKSLKKRSKVIGRRREKKYIRRCCSEMERQKLLFHRKGVLPISRTNTQHVSCARLQIASTNTITRKSASLTIKVKNFSALNYSTRWDIAVLNYEIFCQIRDHLVRQHLTVAQTARALGLDPRDGAGVPVAQLPQREPAAV